MSITREKIEQLAPDQESLTAARKLLKPASWPTLAHADGLIWGECQGSGSTPYRVAVHESDAGYKCTCPSRKFPCKHALALMWMRADQSGRFTPADVPAWAQDWLSRRRPGSAAPAQQSGPRPSLDLTAASEPDHAPGPKAEHRAAAARDRNRRDREAAVLAGLEELDTWLSDQVQRGMATFVEQAAPSCRTIAQRLVDAKAPGLAGRLDALPSRLYTLPSPARPSAAVRELGQVHLISQAYRRESLIPPALAADARQAVGWSLSRESLLADPDALRVRAAWRVFAVVAEVQPDRLRRIDTWLIRHPATGGSQPDFAELIDFVPASAGNAVGGYVPGDSVDAELAFYPSSIPLRAQIATLGSGAVPGGDTLDLPVQTLPASWSRYQQAITQLPWLGAFPIPFRSARVRRNGDSLYLHDEESRFSLPVASAQSTDALPLASLPAFDGIGLWNGYEFTLAWANTSLGAWWRQ